MTEKAFDEIVDRYARPILFIIRKMIGRREEADDLVQNVFVKLWEYRSALDLSKPVFTLLYKMAMNQSIDYLRKMKTQTAEPEIMEFITAPPLEENEELQEIISKCSDHLKPKQKAVFLLRDMEGFEFEEISEILQIPVANIRSNLHLARKRIRELLEVRYQINLEYMHDL